MGIIDGMLGKSKKRRSLDLQKQSFALDQEFLDSGRSLVDICRTLENMIKKNDRRSLALFTLGHQCNRYCFNQFLFPEIGSGLAHISIIYNIHNPIAERLKGYYTVACGNEILGLFNKCLDYSVELISNAIDLEPNFGRAYHSRAITRFYMLMPDEAKKDFENALSLWTDEQRPPVHELYKSIKDCESVDSWIKREVEGLANSCDMSTAQMVRTLLRIKSQNVLVHLVDIAQNCI